jgi:WhiB family transcriptional regulator, redox-sensing transcriptional regulator
MKQDTPGSRVILDEIAHGLSWMARAACRGEPTETFFPGRGGSLSRAKEFCRGCVVAGECLDFAMADEELQGVWAGTTVQGRARLRRQAS